MLTGIFNWAGGLMRLSPVESWETFLKGIGKLEGGVWPQAYPRHRFPGRKATTLQADLVTSPAAANAIDLIFQLRQ
jgi:hypothetical protein